MKSAAAQDPGVSIDLFEKMPAPFGLIRYGVAPDHPRIKGIITALHKVLDKPQVRLLGNVDYGTDITLEDLRRHYDAVIFSTGAVADRNLEIPGIDLDGSYGAAEFVAWYDGHPDFSREWPLTEEKVAVLGVGNVGLDVARVLALNVPEATALALPIALPHRAHLALRRREDRVVRLTGDNPVGDSTLIDELVEAMDAGGYEYGRNDVSHMPEGLGCEVFRVRDLRRAAASTSDPYDREHVTPWLRRNVKTLDFVPAANPGDPERFRCTVDVLSDYDRVCRLFANKPDPVAVPWTDLIAEIGGPAFTAGPSVPRRDDSELDQSVMILGGQAFTGPLAPSSTEIRAMLATAVNRGVNHVEVGRGDHNAEAILHKCGEPQLTQRLHFISRLREIRTNDPRLAATTVEAQLERSFAELGRRKASAVLMANVDEAHSADGTGWHRLRDYRESGEVGRIGVNVESLDELRRALELTDLGYVQFPLGVADRA